MELVFRVTDERVRTQLAALDVYPENDEVILTRKIANGRGAAKVNAETVPASRMREIAALLIDIHGQHEHQSLLQKKKHLEILDDYASEELKGPKSELLECYRNYKKLLEELEAADVNEDERLRELSFLEYEVEEIEKAQLRVGEDEELEADFRKFSNARKIAEAVGNAYASTAGDGGGASDFFGKGAARTFRGSLL